MANPTALECIGGYTRAEIKKMADDAVRYLCSPEGQMKLREHNEAAKELADMFRRARHIPLEKLHEPFTI